MSWQGQTRYCYDLEVEGVVVQMVQCGVVPEGIQEYPEAHIDIPLSTIPRDWVRKILSGDICRFVWTIDKTQDALRWLP